MARVQLSAVLLWASVTLDVDASSCSILINIVNQDSHNADFSSNQLLTIVVFAACQAANKIFLFWQVKTESGLKPNKSKAGQKGKSFTHTQKKPFCNLCLSSGVRCVLWANLNLKLETWRARLSDDENMFQISCFSSNQNQIHSCKSQVPVCLLYVGDWVH